MSLSLTASPVPPPHKALADNQPKRAAVTPVATPQPQPAAQSEQPPETPAPVSQPTAPPAPAPVAPTPTDPKAYAASVLDATQYGCLISLWNGESGWNVYATNASSGAYGIPQALPGGKMATAGADWQTNGVTQVIWGLSYIASSYGTPCNAYYTWLARYPHWY